MGDTSCYHNFKRVVIKGREISVSISGQQDKGLCSNGRMITKSRIYLCG